MQVGDKCIERSGVLGEIFLDFDEFVDERGYDEHEQEDESAERAEKYDENRKHMFYSPLLEFVHQRFKREKENIGKEERQKNLPEEEHKGENGEKDR